MSGFTNEQMNRPLFEEPISDISRPDEWSTPLGFLIGGMANNKFQHLGQQYYDAAKLLIQGIRHQDIEDYLIANPVLYLYRHSIELFVKALLLDAAKTHNLDTLADEYEAFITDQFGSPPPSWIVMRMKEIGAIDPNSTAFRYNQVYDRSIRADRSLDGEYHIDLNHLESAMSALVTALVGSIAMIDLGEGRSARIIR